ncbi:MAG: RNA polymerase sigma factor [Bacteroidia bacterium]
MQTALKNVLSDEELLKRIIAGDRNALHRLYQKHRDAFLAWAYKRYACQEEDAADVYQDAIIVLYENALAGKIHGKSALKTYLFGVGKNLILKRYEHTKRFTEEGPEETGETDVPMEETIVMTERQEVLQRALQELGEACRRLLIRFYYDRYSTEAMMSEFGYKSKDVVKSQKARCMRSLRNLLRDKASFLLDE